MTTIDDPAALAAVGARSSLRRRVFIASAVGSVIEYYDFLIYATAASLVFPKVFFPNTDGALGVIASFGTLAVGYLARPLGGVLFGHLGDRLGRKSMLLWTLGLMGASTLLIGLLPSHAQIGLLAPVLLVALRLLQGVAVGGEWGGAALMAVEHADTKRRGLLGSATQIGMSAGLLLSFAAFAALGALDQDDFLAWGWRLPFIATVVMVALGVYIRIGIEESPVAEDAKLAANADRRIPLVAVLRDRPRQVLLGTFLYVGPFMAYTVATTMLVAYASKEYGIERQSLLNGMMIGTAGMLITIPAFAMLSDRIGRRPVYITSALLTAAWVFVLFPLVTSGSFALIVLAYFVSMTLLNASANSPVPALLAELFPTSTRYTGVSVCYQIGGMIGGGLGPLIATTFIVPGGPGVGAVSAMIAALCVISALCAHLLGDTRRVDLRDA
ncbi:MFS transporter [Gordonia spumicola]|uniref:MFS transporter n=1 Tax=Gordonia spumicola TaxID=589161 RepID=A0A7I9V923_9ACTN|nr:MFS transporter [Gordonia spumicola]GEE01643.1 MFS transporter [Gordonia spumicola]GEE01799.1 MFS transporter [Gordonia spumicola]